MLFQRKQNSYQNYNQGGNTGKRNLLIILSVATVLLIIITSLLSGNKKGASTGQNGGLNLDQYEASGYSISKPSSFKASGSSELTTLKDDSTDKPLTGSISIQRYALKADGLDPETLQATVDKKGDGTSIDGVTAEAKVINNYPSLVLTVAKSSDGLPEGKTYYVFGSVNIWKITFDGKSDSVLLQNADKILDTFTLKRSDGEPTAPTTTTGGGA